MHSEGDKRQRRIMRTCIAPALMPAHPAYAGNPGRGDGRHVADAWVGTYDVVWVKGSPAARDGDRSPAVIDKVPDMEPSSVAPRYRSNLERWRLGGADGSNDLSSLLRRFDHREYAEMGWDARHAAGTISCLNGRGLFICRTKPGARITIEPQDGKSRDALPTRTGLFGVALHRGGFELERIR